jgi:2-methylcitrate dehydratase PrpD
MPNDPKSLTYRLADFATSARYDDLPAPVVRECKRLLLDTIGCAVGAINTPSARVALNYARIQGGAPAATVLGLDAASSATTAAYINGRLANILDADDTFPTATHFGNTTVFAALALAEHFGRSGRDLIKAIAVGFDVGARIGSWLGVPMQIKDGKVVGFNEVAGPAATMTWAGVGSAVSISGIDAERACHAFGIAGANSPQPTMRKYGELVEVPMYKYADTGWCTEVGVSATLLASLGSTGFAGILDGEFGFWRFYGSPSHDDEALLAGLGSNWQILNTTYKPWPCCRFIHYPLTAFGRLREEHGLRPDEIERVVVRAAPFAMTALFRDRQPTDPLNAEFSHPHALAAAAYDLPPGPQWYTPEALEADHMRAFRDRVDVELEPTSANLADWIQGGQWRGIPGGVDIHARGEVYRSTVIMAKGDPWSPESLFSNDELLSKFRAMMGLSTVDGSGDARVRDSVEQVVSAVDDMENLDIAGLMQPLGQLARALVQKVN